MDYGHTLTWAESLPNNTKMIIRISTVNRSGLGEAYTLIIGSLDPRSKNYYIMLSNHSKMWQKEIGKSLALMGILLFLGCQENRSPIVGGWYYFNYGKNSSPTYHELHIGDSSISSYSFYDMFGGHESIYSLKKDSIKAFSQTSYFKVADDTLYTEYFGEIVPMVPFQDKLNSTPATRFIALMSQDINYSDSVNLQNFIQSMKDILWESHFPEYTDISQDTE